MAQAHLGALAGAVGAGETARASPACRAVESWKRRASASGSKAELIAEARRCCTSWGWGPWAALYRMLWLQRRNERRLSCRKLCVGAPGRVPGVVPGARACGNLAGLAVSPVPSEGAG